MSSYTITITPDDRARATTTLRVEVSDTTARVTELLVRAGDGDGLTAGQLPAVDLDQLLRAVIPTPAAAIAQTAPATPSEAPTPAEPAATPESAAEPAAPAVDPQAASDELAPASGQVSKRTAGTRPRRGGAATKKTPAGGDTKRSARTSGATKALKTARTSTATKAAAAKKSIEKTSASGERAYRRAPEDLAEVYRQAGTTAAVADHYGVPRHTAYGWIRKLSGATATAVS